MHANAIAIAAAIHFSRMSKTECFAAGKNSRPKKARSQCVARRSMPTNRSLSDFGMAWQMVMLYLRTLPLFDINDSEVELLSCNYEIAREKKMKSREDAKKSREGRLEKTAESL
jgi:hypothetical protein